MKPGRLRLLVMHVSTRCDQTCAHCSIWKGRTRAVELGEAERIQIIHEARGLGALSILFTGGEPLLCNHIERLARTARQIGMSVQIATNGLGLGRASSWLSDAVSEAYVSVEGPEAIHDGVRGARSFARLKEAVTEVAALPRRPKLIGRCAVTSRNAAVLDDTARAARDLGLDGLSFLPIDVTSEAFGGAASERKELGLSRMDVEALRSSVARLKAMDVLNSFVLEDERKLSSMCEALAEAPSSRATPRCNAPEWSSVVEADGAIRPCFFQPIVASGGAPSLRATRESLEYTSSLSRLGEGNSTCAACVCPKHLATGLARWTGRVRAVLNQGRTTSAAGTSRAA